MGEALRITELLGGKATVEGEIQSPADAIRLIKDGIPARAIAALMSRLRLSRQQFSKITGISERTLARRLGGERLNLEESNRVYRLAQIMARAEAAFGSEEKACLWLSRANRSLGGALPIELLETEAGTEEVRKSLGRIEHGIYG